MYTLYSAPRLPFKTKITPNGTVVRMYHKGDDWYIYAGTRKYYAPNANEADRIYNGF